MQRDGAVGGDGDGDTLAAAAAAVLCQWREADRGDRRRRLTATQVTEVI